MTNKISTCSCNNCGSVIPWTKFCNNCGKEFCVKCSADEYIFNVPTCPRCLSEDVDYGEHKNFKEDCKKN